MKKYPKIIDALKDKNNKEIITSYYKDLKEYLNKEFQEMDDSLLVSYLMAHIVNLYEAEDDLGKQIFINRINNGFTIIDFMNDFVDKINGSKAELGDRVKPEVIPELMELKNYKATDVYKELSKSNKEIAKLIKEKHGYFTMSELKKKAKEEPPEGVFKPYIISEDELHIIECTKEYGVFNQLAHLLYDEKKGYRYCCDHEINCEEDELKRLLVNTKHNNPRFDILFNDGTIIEYYRGDIRKKPYNFKQVVILTKLYYAKNYKEMKEKYEKAMYISSTNNDSVSYQLGRNMVIDSFLKVIDLLDAYEEVYTRKMIDDSKKEFIKIQETAKKYNL